jgi:mRNA interferase RelE/StbE
MSAQQWSISFIPAAKKDMSALDGSTRAIVERAIRRVSANPLPQSEGGYGKPLGNRMGIDLTGCYKIKLRKQGIRVVYKLIREKGAMRVIVIAARADGIVYKLAAQRNMEL